MCDGMNSFARWRSAECASHTMRCQQSVDGSAHSVLMSEGHSAAGYPAKKFIASHSIECCHALLFIASHSHGATNITLLWEQPQAPQRRNAFRRFSRANSAVERHYRFFMCCDCLFRCCHRFRNACHCFWTLRFAAASHKRQWRHVQRLWQDIKRL